LSSTGFIARHSDRIFGFQQSRTRSRYYLGWRVLMFCWCGGSVCSYLGKNIFSFWTSQQTEVRKHYFALHCLFFCISMWRSSAFYAKSIHRSSFVALLRKTGGD